MEIMVNHLAVFLAAVSSMVVGGLWYSQVLFGKQWMEEMKFTEADIKDGAMKAMIGAFILSLLTAWVLAHTTYLSSAFFTEMTFFQTALTTAFWLWLGISMTTHVTHALFEQRTLRHILISIGNRFVTIMVMGLIIGWMGVASATPPTEALPPLPSGTPAGNEELGTIQETTGTVSEVNTEQAALDGPVRVTLATEDGGEVVVAIPSMGLPLCAAKDNIVDAWNLPVGAIIEVRGGTGPAGEIVPCDSPDHYMRTRE